MMLHEGSFDSNTKQCGNSVVRRSVLGRVFATLRRLKTDEAGMVVSAELVMVSTVLGIGMITGLTSLRNQVVQELVDVGQAIGSLNQSYCYGGISKEGVAFTGGSCYIDVADFCQSTCQAPGQEPGGIQIRSTYPECLPPAALYGEVGCATNQPTPACDCEVGSAESVGTPPAVVSVFDGYPLGVVRAEIEEKTTSGGEVLIQDAQAKACTVNCRIAVSVDRTKYQQFQGRLVQQLDHIAMRKGSWIAATTERPGTLAVQDPLGLVDARYEGLVDIKPEQRFAAGAWGTDKADLGRETVVLVNTAHDATGPEVWQWFDIRRMGVSVRSALQVRIDYIGAAGNTIAQDFVPVNVGCNACPPGLEVFDLVSRRDGDSKTLSTLGGLNGAATAASLGRAQGLGSAPQDLLVMVSPYLALANGGEPPKAFASRLVFTLSKKLTRDESKDLKDVRCTVVAMETPR